MPFRNQLGIDGLQHLPYSPNLNPIENMWDLVKYKLRKRKRHPRDQEKLWKWLQEEWEAIPIETVNRIIDPMEWRRTEVKRLKGYAFKC